MMEATTESNRSASKAEFKCSAAAVDLNSDPVPRSEVTDEDKRVDDVTTRS